MSETTTAPESSKPTNLASKDIPLPAFLTPKNKVFKRKELVQMFKSLASMLKAQINTADAVKYYSHGHANPDVTKALAKINTDINNGISVHEAFKRTKKFDEMTIGLIQAGGEAGQLDTAFSELGKRIKSDLHFRKKIRKLILIPCIVIPVLMGAFIASQVKIVPQVEQMMTGIEPAGIVKLSFQISHFIQKTWPGIVLTLILIVLCIWKINPLRIFLINLCMARIRIVKLMVMALRQMTMLSTIRLLYSNGINLAKSLRVGANSVNKTPFYGELNKAADMYEKSGVPLSSAFAKYTSVDPQVVHMLAIGEKSASLDVQLSMLSDMFEEDAEQLMDDFSQFVSFIVMLIAVGLIAAVFIGTFMPIFMMGPQMMQDAL